MSSKGLEIGMRFMSKVVLQMQDEHDVTLSIYPRRGLEGRPEIVVSVAPREGYHLDHKSIGYLNIDRGRFVVTDMETAEELCPKLGSVLTNHGYVWTSD